MASDGSADEFDDDEGYGLSPARRLQVELRVRPAWVAVAVEVLFVLLVGNQWMLDHLVEPWSRDSSGIRRGLADTLASFAWSLIPNGYGWVFLGAIVHALVWFVGSYFLVRAATRVADAGPRIVCVVGSIVVAAVLALLADRLVTYPDVQKLADQAARPGLGFVEWTLFGSIAGGAVLAVVVVAVLAALATELVAGEMDEDDVDEDDVDEGSVDEGSVDEDDVDEDAADPTRSL